jgi:hypothetical protein
MRPLRISVVSAVLTLAAAISFLPVQVANAQTPSTTVIVPSDNATVSGTSQTLDASATSGATQVQYEITGGTLTDSVIATATPTYYGWFAQWNTTTVANGSYTLESVASYAGGVNATSAGITVTVDNPAPATAVVFPANNATVSGTTQYFDATASSAVTSVTYELSGGPSDLSDVQIATGTGTLIGWLAAWDTTTVANGTYTLQSVASYSGGVSAASAPVTINVNNAPPSTTVVFPASGATLDSTQNQYFDAVASPGVTQVTIDVTGEYTPSFTLTTIPTLYGWIGVLPGSPIPSGEYCGPFTFSNSIQSVASYAGGVSGTSASVPVTVDDVYAQLPGGGC